MFNRIRNGLQKAHSEDAELVKKWKNHPVKMLLRTLSILAGAAISILIMIVIESVCGDLAFGSYDYIVFLGQNGWAYVAIEVLWFLTFLIIVGILFLLIEIVDSIINRKKEKENSNLSFFEKELSEEKTDKDNDRKYIAILSIIVFLIILFMAGCVYVWSFSTTVFTNDKIIAKSVFNPVGTEYIYSDITKVEVSSGDHACLNFDLYMKNGDRVKLRYGGGYSSDNDEYNEYAEAFLSDFTDYLREKNIPITFDCVIYDIADYCGDEYDKYLKNIFYGK